MMTYKDIKDVKEKFVERCDKAIEELCAARDELFETMGQVSPMFSNDYKDIMSRALKDLEPWESAMCKCVDRAVNPNDEELS